MKRAHLQSRTIIANIQVDGGGVKSYSSLLILKALMERVQLVLQKEKALTNETNAAGLVQEHQEAPQLKPADIFSFMYGSSSGG